MNNPSACPHFPLCSGCTLADPYHPPLWQEALSFFLCHSVTPSLHTDGFSQTRLKAKLAVRPGPKIGLFKKNSHDVLPIPHCLVHHSAINRAVAFIQQKLIEHSIQPYSEADGKGTLRYLQLFVERSTGRVQLALVLARPFASSSFYESLKGWDGWHSIWVNIQPAVTNKIFGDEWRLISGEPFLWQTVNQTPVAFHPAAFSQTHFPLFEKMIQKIEEWIEPSDRILELYAGVGAIGLCLAKKAPDITLVENNPYAYLSFQQTGSPLPYLCIDAKEVDLSEYHTIIVDPPRKGLDPALLQKLTAHQGRLIYVSCGFESFQRDAEALISSGWRLKASEGYLLFPGTNHVETLALFEKAPSGH